MLLFSFCLIMLSLKVSFCQPAGIRVPAEGDIKTYKLTDGLPSKNTTATLKDKRGFVWVGTENGLCRFDGYHFKVFSAKINDDNSITNNYINALCEDHNGRIWVATMDGLNLFDPLSETFTRFFHSESKPGSLSNNKVWSLLCDKNGVIWVGTDDGFNEYLPRQKRFIVYKPNASKKGSMMGKSVNSIIEDEENNLWLGNWSGGLNKFDKKNRSFSNFLQYQATGEKNPNDIWSLCYGTDGMIWVGTYWSGLFKFNPATARFSKVKHAEKGKYTVFSLMNVDQQSILVGQDDGFYFLDTRLNEWTKIGNIQNFAYGDSYKDNEGVIWINARNGLHKINKTAHKFRLNSLSLVNREVTSIVVQHPVIWLGTNNGLSRINIKSLKVETFVKEDNNNSLTSNNVSRLYLDSQNTLWILTEDGFDSYDERGKHFTHHSHHSVLGNLFNEDVFRDILEVERGIYVLATDAGIKVYDLYRNQFKHYYNQPDNPLSINNNHTYNLAKAPDGKIWVGTYGGGINIFDMKTGHFQSIMTTDRYYKGLSSNVINAIYTDSKKNIWVCTTDGLNKYDLNNHRFITYAKKDGFSSNIFKEITEDRQGTIWLTTENGVSSLNTITKEIRNFDETDGLSVNTVIANSEREIFVAGNKGYLYFDPKQILTDTTVYPVYITDFQLFNKTVLPDPNGPLKDNLNIAKEIILAHDQSVFSLEFVALNFASTPKNRYAYRLVGFDEKWNEVGNQRKATYTNLNPGSYRFEVKASNNDGVWNKQLTTLIITINPPWYHTWWAYLLYSGLIVLGGYVYISYRREQEKLKYEIKIAHLESEKEKELNEKKLSFFTNISHEFRTPLTLIINPVKDLLYQDNKNLDISSMNIVYRNAKRLLSLVDQLLLFSKTDAEADAFKASKLNIVDLVKEVFYCFTNQAKTCQINYNFYSSSECVEVFADREKLEIVIFNLLSNSFKFTPNQGEITVRVQENLNDVNILVQDSGCGIPEESQEKIFNRFYQEDKSSFLGTGFGIGLYLVKSFIEMHGGEINCQSSKGKGTLFNVLLLKGKNHINPSLLIADVQEGSRLINEVNDYDLKTDTVDYSQPGLGNNLSEERKTILIVDDNEEIASYLREIFSANYQVMHTWDAESGLLTIRELLPDIVISDVMMAGMGGVELCSIVKEDESVCHIPIVLLTGSTSAEIKLKGIESGADDFISKPFDKDLLMARIAGILKSKNSLQKYFYSEITLNPNSSRISAEYKDFLSNCINIVEKHMENPDFNIKILAEEIGMSRENLFKKIKSISGHTSNSFIRFIRLRKAAEIFISTDNTIRETMYMVGLNDIKHFREQFKKVFLMNPSEYIKKYRKIFSHNHSINRDLKRNS
ncbi:hybrid sensor histidine kinase/response regulator [Pedobacter rhizosphaerae]|uniref:histidine kinase n=1 Tax=Pedobacter rhizosphaerae TaxID=390241 RepID=A0A1H9R3F6_9SPHI|nr:two-component regulator propeller domain-containing protein [Pedobacter rhizosphaerae]SER66579.1 Signal transduction histidine kinase [Pedobacter rhizosphaerae]